MTSIAVKVSENLLVRKAERAVAAATHDAYAEFTADLVALVRAGRDIDADVWERAVDVALLPALGEVFARAYDTQAAALRDSLSAATPRTSTEARRNAEQYLRRVRNRLLDVPDDLFRTLRRSLAEGVAAGESDQQLAERVRSLIDVSVRANRIARTETTPALNAGRLQAARAVARETGVSTRGWRKEWVSMHDERVRHSHAAADGQSVALNALFTVGGSRGRFPGDPMLPPDETINCRCTLRIEAGASLTSSVETEDSMDDDIDYGDLDPEASIPWHGVLAPEAVLSGDRRKFAQGALSLRDLPVPLHYQDATADGHDGAVRVANILAAKRATNEDGTSVLRAWGMFDTHDTADEAIRQIAKQMLRGVSVDVDSAEFTFEDEFGNDIGGKSPLEVPNPIMNLTAGRVSGATLCSIPAFQEAFVALGPPPSEWGFEVDDNLAAWIENDLEDVAAETDGYALSIEVSDLDPDIIARLSGEEFAQVSDKPWSSFTQADYTDEQWRRACVLDKGTGEGKQRYGLPIREPSGALNRNAVHAAAARFNQVHASAEAKAKAKNALRRAYGALKEEPPDVLTAAAPRPRDDSLDSEERPGHGEGGGKPRVSTKPWSDFSQSDYTDEQWARACALHYKAGYSTKKSDHALPYREPNGAINVQGVKQAAADFPKIQASGPAKAAARRRLQRAFDTIGEQAPGAIAETPREEASVEVEEFLAGDDSGIPGHMPRKLKAYWTHGEGAAKIAWGTGGDFERCRSNLSAYVPAHMLSGLCAKLHKAATGQWPGRGRSHSVDVTAGTALTSRCEPCAAGLTASASVQSDFTAPTFECLTPLTVTREGRVFGHLAGWGTCHIGFDGVCVTPPTSATNYAYFHTGEVLTSDGWKIPVGHITMGTGHAQASLRAAPAVEHYDNTGTVVADVVAGEDAYGIWVAGRLRSGVTEEQRTALAAAALSGDWRRIGGSMELVAALAVNVPGFPIPRLQAAMRDAQPAALMASGIVVGGSGPASGPVTEPEPIGHAIGEFLRRQRRAEAATATVEAEARDARRRRARAAVEAVLAAGEGGQ